MIGAIFVSYSRKTVPMNDLSSVQIGKGISPWRKENARDMDEGQIPRYQLGW